MPILNYTTKVSAERTIMSIQKMLAKFGAIAILIEYGPEGEESALSFRFMHEGVMLSFRLPARLDAIYKILCDTCEPRYHHREQAARVTWRILKDWVEAQLAIVEAEQADLVEVFLPYAQNEETGQTLYKSIREGGFKLLGGPDRAS